MRQFYSVLIGGSTVRGAICKAREKNSCRVRHPNRFGDTVSDGSFSDEFLCHPNQPVYLDFQSANNGGGVSSISLIPENGGGGVAKLSVIEYGTGGNNDWYK